MGFGQHGWRGRGRDGEFAEPEHEVALKPTGIGLQFPSGSIVSVERAELALQQVSAERQRREQEYNQEQVACFKKFFMSSCTETAKEKYRLAGVEIRAVEIEADFVRRRDRAEQRDKVIAERAAQEEREAPQRLQETAAREKAAAEKAQQRTAAASKLTVDQAKQVGIDPLARQRNFDTKVAQQNAKDAAAQLGIAAKTASLAKKQADALARQKQIADKKQKKAAEQAAKLASEQKAADSAAAEAAKK